jgi:hypothetical protein
MQTTSLHPLDSVPYLDPIKIPKMGSGRVAFASFTFPISRKYLAAALYSGAAISLHWFGAAVSTAIAAQPSLCGVVI